MNVQPLKECISVSNNCMARLASSVLYYVMTVIIFTLDINNPAKPKLFYLPNNPQKSEVYGAVLSLHISRIMKLVNQRNKLKSSLIFDEFPTIFFKGTIIFKYSCPASSTF